MKSNDALALIIIAYIVLTILVFVAVFRFARYFFGATVAKNSSSSSGSSSNSSSSSSSSSSDSSSSHSEPAFVPQSGGLPPQPQLVFESRIPGLEVATDVFPPAPPGAFAPVPAPQVQQQRQ